MRPGRLAVLAAIACFTRLQPNAAEAQQIDLSRGGPIEVTASDGLEWRQNEQEVIARGNARAVRGGVTVTADRLIAHYRKKAQASGAQAAQPAPTAARAGAPASGDIDTSGNEIYRLDAEGNVHIFTATDHAEGDQAVYDMDQAVLVLTGRHLKLTTPQQIMTARDSMEYWAQKHMAVGRGDAVVVTSDGRRMAADTLVGYTTDQSMAAPPPRPVPVAAAPPDTGLPDAGKLQKVEAFGHVDIRTAIDTVRGDRAVYVPDTGIARVAGHVRITRGDNQLNGNEADVNLKTGISTLLSAPGARVQGLVVPSDTQSAPPNGRTSGAGPSPALPHPAPPGGATP